MRAGIIHKFCRDIYSKRFPELEQLVLNPLDYMRAVNVMRNNLDIPSLDLTQVGGARAGTRPP